MRGTFYTVSSLSVVSRFFSFHLVGFLLQSMLFITRWLTVKCAGERLSYDSARRGEKREARNDGRSEGGSEGKERAAVTRCHTVASS